MAVLVGIDEAGFGPILGPLVVSSSSFLVPDHLLTSNLWQILKRSVAKKHKQLSGRLLITDSKKAYSKSLGIKHLQRTVLSAFECLDPVRDSKTVGHIRKTKQTGISNGVDKKPATIAELIELLCPDCLVRLNEYPWYKGSLTDELPISDRRMTIENRKSQIEDFKIASAVLADDLNSNGIRLRKLKSICFDVGYYNKMMSSMRNKANVLFFATSQLIKNAFDDSPSNNVQIIVDRQGGRVHYREHLQRMFPDMELAIIREDQKASIYGLQADGRTMRLHFVVDADEQFLPVSLASMVSKYLRELLVGNINRYFIAFCPGIKPTAGYWKDGLRFIEDLQMKAPHVKFSRDQLIRCR
jgi:ribonuclease HII